LPKDPHKKEKGRVPPLREGSSETVCPGQDKKLDGRSRRGFGEGEMVRLFTDVQPFGKVTST